MSYRCSVCGELHDDLPHLGLDMPDQWWDVPEDQRDTRITLTSDTCIIDEDYFIRGLIEIPVHDYPQRFAFNVWVSQKQENFETYLANFDSSEIGPFFGWLCTNLDCYGTETTFLKTMVHFRGGGLRPSIELEPTDHPLAVDQWNGISVERAWEIVHFYTDSPEIEES